jgi:hypothetical protein
MKVPTLRASVCLSVDPGTGCSWLPACKVMHVMNVVRCGMQQQHDDETRMRMDLIIYAN